MLRPATALLLSALSLEAGCMLDEDPGYAPKHRPEIPELALFEDVVRRTSRSGGSSAVALAVDPGRLTWGAAVSANSTDEAKKLALMRCAARARLEGISSPCVIYAVNGRPLYLDRS